MTANVLLSRVHRARRARVRDRPRRPLRDCSPGWSTGAQQIELGADDSPYALNPWDVPDPAKVSREKIAFLLSLHQRDDGRRWTRQAEIAHARRRRSAPSTPRPPRSRTSRRASRCCATSCARMAEAQPARRRRRASPRCCATSPTRLTEYCGEGTYAYLLDRETTVPADSPLVVFDTRRCPRDVLRPGDVLDHGVRHRHRRAPLGTRTSADAAQPGAPLFAGPLDHADRRGLAPVRRARDRRVRQRPRAAAPATSGWC